MHKLIGLLLACLLASGVHAAELPGKVVGVMDGDTLVVLDGNNQQHRIRLAAIDAPEKSQAFGNKSKEALSDMAFGKSVTVAVTDKDQYGRTVGTVYVNGVDINLEQVKQGMAWVYRQYARDQRYYTAERQAKDSRKGLWVDSHPTPPWEFRRDKRSEHRPTNVIKGFCGKLCG